MKRWVYTVCDYVYEGENAPEKCPQCEVPASKFREQVSEGMAWACEHEVGMAQSAPEDVMMDLGANFEGGCSEMGMYLTMSRVARRESYPEIGICWAKTAFKEAEHAAKFTELLGEVVTSSTKRNLEIKVVVENGAAAGKFDLAKGAKTLSLDATHNAVHEIARDEARHGKAFESLLSRYFG